jgi:rhodanese-related sulfurtransferase
LSNNQQSTIKLIKITKLFMKYFKKMFFAVFCCFFLLSCSKSEDNTISAKNAMALLSAGQVTLIDIRRPEEWRQTGIARGASKVNMLHPQGMSGFAQEVALTVNNDLDAPIVLICRTGSRTARAAMVLSEMGFTNVKHVPEGMVGSSAGVGWIEQSLPIDPCKNC